MQAAGIDGVDGSRGSRFSHPSLALEAAIGGQGVALSIDLLATPEIAAGRLVAPFDIRIPLDNGYYLVGASDALDQPRVREFRDWIMTEATA